MQRWVVSGVMISMLAVAGCAKKSENITPEYVSPVLYQGYSCSQIREEATRVSSEASRVMGVQDKTANNDAAATAVGLVLFWPALFFIKSGSDTAAQVAHLKGQMNALEQESIRKKCGISFRKAPSTAEKPSNG